MKVEPCNDWNLCAIPGEVKVAMKCMQQESWRAWTRELCLKGFVHFHLR